MASTNDPDLRRLQVAALNAKKAYKREQQFAEYLKRKTMAAKTDEEFGYSQQALEDQQFLCDAAQLQTAVAVAVYELAEFESVFGHVAIEGIDRE